MSLRMNSAVKKLPLLEVIERKTDLSIFAELLAASAVAKLFDDQRQFTVFAPTNAAFEKLSAEQMSTLITEKDLAGLTKLLSYHILPSRRTAAAISGLRTETTIAGSDVRFDDRHGLKVNDANVGLRNIEAANGVVHMIDKVLSPPLAAESSS
jgi:uncharacterized surface protein with fasciclin (FAS1) repeats